MEALEGKLGSVEERLAETNDFISKHLDQLKDQVYRRFGLTCKG